MRKLTAVRFLSFLAITFVLFTTPAFAAPECEPGFICYCTSPILIDVGGHGFKLTDAINGVSFDILGNGRPLQIAWTERNSLNAWLALDRNGNGKIDNGQELFGNFTPQPQCKSPNGFLALAQYDKPENGGRSDDVIDNQDAVYQALQLWIDANHNGVSEPEELFTLPQLSVFSIALDYKTSQKHDRNGNMFRYRSRVNLHQPHSTVGPFAFDVFLSSILPSAATRRALTQPVATSTDASGNDIPVEVAYRFFLHSISCDDSDPEVHKQRCARMQRALGLTPQDESQLSPHMAGFREEILTLDSQVAKAARSEDQAIRVQRPSLEARRHDLIEQKIFTLRQRLSPEGQARLDAYIEGERRKIKFIPSKPGGVQ